MNNRVPQFELKQLNSDSSLTNFEFVERNLLHSVFANPVVHKGSHDHSLPSAPTPGEVRMIFGTNLGNNGQPEYACSPTTMIDPLEWSSVYNGNVPTTPQCAHNMAGSTSTARADEEHAYRRNTTPTGSDYKVNVRDFIKKENPDENKIKTEIEKIFAPFTEQTDSTDRKEVVGKILQRLISKFGLLRIYTTLQMVEDELNLQTSEMGSEDNNINYYMVQDTSSEHDRKCLIAEISSNESVMTRKSADILQALFLKNNLPDVPSDVSTSEEEEKELFYSARNLQEWEKWDDKLQRLMSDPAISQKFLKLSSSPVKECLATGTNSSSKEYKRVAKKDSHECKKSITPKGSSKVVSRTNSDSQEHASSNSWSSHKENFKTRTPKQQGALSNRNSVDQTDPSMTAESERYSWTNDPTLTGREKLALLKKKLKGRKKAEKLAKGKALNLTEKVKESRQKLRQQNQAYLVSKRGVSDTNIKTCTLFVAKRKNFSSCRHNTENKMPDTGRNGFSKTMYEDDQDVFATPVGSKAMFIDEQDLQCTSYNSYLNQKGANHQTESRGYVTSVKTLFIIAMLILFAIGIGCMIVRDPASVTDTNTYKRAISYFVKFT